MQGMTIAEAVQYHYPLSAVCAHKETKEHLEQEIDDDRYQDLVVDRCTNCNFPISTRYATYEERESFRNANHAN